MSRDTNGNYTLPAGNPVLSGTTIDTEWANPTMSDLGSEVTNSLSRSGRGGMLAPLKGVNGSRSSPAFTFTEAPTTGAYLAGVNDYRISLSGVDVLRVVLGKAQIWDSTNEVWRELSTDSGGGGTPTVGVATTFNSVAGLKSGIVNGVDESDAIKVAIIENDVLASTLGYYGAMYDTVDAKGGGVYTLTTLARVRAAKSDPSWVPDGAANHYLFGAVEYVALLNFTDRASLSQLGVKGDGIFDDSATLLAAFNAEIPLKGSPTDVYLLNEGVDVVDKSVDIHFMGGLMKYNVLDNSEFRALNFEASMGPTAAVSLVQYNQTHTGSKRCLIITVNDASGFSIGDAIKLASDDAINPYGDADERLGQAFEVIDIVGNDIYTHTSTDLRFITDVSISRYNSAITCKIRGLRATHSNPELAEFQIMLNVYGMVSPEINDCYTFDTGAIALRVHNCFRASGGNLKGADLRGDTTIDQTGYVVVDQGSSESSWGVLEGRRVRHVYTTGAENIPALSPVGLYGGACNCKVDTVVGFEGHSFAADTHPDSYNTVIDRVIVVDSGQERSEQTGACQLRGWKDYIGSIDYSGSDHGVYFNWTYRDCAFGDIVARGGRIITSVANPSNPDSRVKGNSATLYVDDKQVFGVSIKDSSFIIDDLKLVFLVKDTFLSFKTALSLSSSGGSFSAIVRNFTSDLTEINPSEWSAYTPIQVQTDWDEITVENYYHRTGADISASDGLSTFIAGSAPVDSNVVSKLEVRNFVIEAPTFDKADVVTQFKGTGLSPLSSLAFNYKVIAQDRTGVSNKQFFEVFTSGMFLMHADKWNTSETAPYINNIEDMETVLSATATPATIAELQPPYKYQQRWKLTNRTASAFSVLITYAAGITVTLVAGATLELVANDSLVWEIM